MFPVFVLSARVLDGALAPDPERCGRMKEVNGRLVMVCEKQDISTLTKEIQEAHLRVENAARATLKRARRVGELLLKAKEISGHGEWGNWLKTNEKGLGFSPRTANRYMLVAERWEEVKNCATLDVANERLVIESKEVTPKPNPPVLADLSSVQSPKHPKSETKQPQNQKGEEEKSLTKR